MEPETLFGKIEAAIEFLNQGMPKPYSVLMAQIETEIEELQAKLAETRKKLEPTELTKEHWRWLASFNSPEPWWANRFSECLKEIDRLTAENKVNANRIEEFEKLLKIFINSPQSMRVPNWVVIKCEQALL